MMNEHATTAAITPQSERKTKSEQAAHRKLLVAGAIGTTIEWYDFFLYGLIAPFVFERLFFPKFDPTTATIAVFATFAVGFLARPLGGVIFGHFGDVVGRKSVLLSTMLIMGLATMTMGLLPTYEAAGVATTIALVLLRFLQGFALGGEATAAGLMAVETASKNSRGLSGAVIQAAGPIGVVLASLSVLLITRLPEADLLSYGWRIPFVASGVLVAVGLYLRYGIEESKLFKAAATTERPAVEAIKKYPKQILIVFFIELAQTSFFYLSAIYTLSYATQTLGVARGTLAQAVLIANICGLFFVPFFGALSDRVGRRPVYGTGLVLAAVSMLVFYDVLAMGSVTYLTIAIVITAGIIHPMMFGPEGSFFPELFPTSVRFSGVSIGKQFGTVLGGGIAPLVAATLYARFGTTTAISVYFIILAVGGGIALAMARETAKSALDE